METTFQVTPTAPSRARRHDFDGLARLDARELGCALRSRNDSGSSWACSRGIPAAACSSVRSLDHGAPARWLRSLAGAGAFPWGGKSFAGDGDRGAGVNRVHLFGRHQLFPFVTRICPSVVDGAPCVVLDYDLPDNPGVIRSIHDEIREIDRGLYLGPAMWKTRHGPKLVLWFSLDTRVQAPPIGLPSQSA